MLNSLTDQYQLISKIGEGSFSEVLKVRDRNTMQLFAAKRLTKNFHTQKDVDDYSELQTLKKLDFHPNVLSLVDYVYETDKGVLTLIFNLMDMSLYDFIRDRKRKLAETRCKNYLHQLLQAVAYLHQNGIFHRDIKPENILLRVNQGLQKFSREDAEYIQLGDLGSVAEISSARPRTAYVSTRWYRSPECLLTSGHYGPKMDIWALGCCFFEILTLQPLFPGGNELDQLDKIHEILGTPSREMFRRIKHVDVQVEFQKHPSIDLKKLWPTGSVQGLDILKKMLMYHPDNRYHASRLLDHYYFNDYKNKKKNYNRLLLSKSDSGNANVSKSPSSCSSRIVSLSNSSSREDSRKVVSLKNLEVKYTKQLELNWNRNECPFKEKIIQNLKSSVQNQRKTLSNKSSLNSFNSSNNCNHKRK